jgi:hypothetical protein
MGKKEAAFPFWARGTGAAVTRRLRIRGNEAIPRNPNHLHSFSSTQKHAMSPH